MILVIGGAGYIGSHTNKLLNQRGFQTIVFDNLSTGYRELVKWGQFFLGDMAEKEQIRHCFKKNPIKAVMHFGAFAYVGESVSHPLKYYRNNVANTLNLLEVMNEFNVRYFIFSSSCAVYGNPEFLPLSEDHPMKPVSPYGRSKLMVEEILKDLDSAYGIKYINLRYFNAAGADPEGELGECHDPETHLIPLVFLTSLGIKDEFKIFGTDYPTKDGTCIRDFIHVADIADAHLRAYEHLIESDKSTVLNLGNGNGYSVKDVINTAREICGRQIKIREIGKRDGDPPKLISDSSKAKTILGWAPQYPDLKSIMDTAWEWSSSRYG
ncbi:UDP-glucose 4-epimerase GalE [Acidobacteriota bacterium]